LKNSSVMLRSGAAISVFTKFTQESSE